MINIIAMRDLVRLDLKELNEDTYRWENAELDRAIMRAVRQFSQHVPRRMKSEISTAAGDPDIDIATLVDRVSIDRVEFPASNKPRTFVRFELYRDTITLIDATGDGNDCIVYWSALHELDAEGSTIPAQYEDLIALGASAYAVMSQSQYSVNLVTSGGENVDRDYLTWARGRLADFIKQCQKAGAKLKQGSLYTE